MCIKTVDHIEVFCNFWSHHWKICRRTSAEDHHIDFIFQCKNIIKMYFLYTFRQNLNAFWITACHYRNKFHIFISLDCKFYTASNVSISNNTNSDFTHCVLLLSRNNLFVTLLQAVGQSLNRFLPPPASLFPVSLMQDFLLHLLHREAFPLIKHLPVSPVLSSQAPLLFSLPSLPVCNVP